MKLTLFGATLGLAWGASLRGWMAVLAGDASDFTWAGTFVAVLLPATLIGAALGWAEQCRRQGKDRAWRWTALTPLLFMAMPALVQGNFMAGLASGLGTGAIMIALVAIVGGYAISGRGPSWARGVSRSAMTALVLALVVAAFVAPAEPGATPAEPVGAYTLLTFLVLCGLLAAACAIPHLPAQHESDLTRGNDR